ncbi:hypothetical protein NHX12_029855 [Muraenolepis orangiensis]|uniref:Immunoglobulin V-set domain-containing protein n=1 Tax=Muraenolepis orangiensis TaxID=630683 RepID=A0A9Q0IM93_9TELE|nr:hypothetical protein NHX12_029855 [Muraenolepis orangiensis]
MTSLVLVWMTVTCLCWTSGSCQVRSQLNVLYPELHTNQTLLCVCDLGSCDHVLWFRSLAVGDHQPKFQFITSVNSAGRGIHGVDVDVRRFTAKMKNAAMWSLHVSMVTREDAGLYSCVLKGSKTEGVWRPGVLLLPGVTPPTPKPEPVKPVCRCLKNSQESKSKGCDLVYTWSLAGVLGLLVAALLSTLFYFSRLPKKCRHH